MVEKHDATQHKFIPKIYVELKSQKGDSLQKALDQATSSMPQLVDGLRDFAMFLIIIKGHYIAFFEYHNDRSNLGEEGVPSYCGAVSFNHAHRYIEEDTAKRPTYKGMGSLDVGFEDEDPLSKIDGIFLDLMNKGHDVVVEEVLGWMKKHESLDITTEGSRSERPQGAVDTAAFPQNANDDEMAD